MQYLAERLQYSGPRPNCSWITRQPELGQDQLKLPQNARLAHLQQQTLVPFWPLKMGHNQGMKSRFNLSPDELLLQVSRTYRNLEHGGSHEWEGETLIEHSKWKLRGTTLNFERRLTFSEGRGELQIVERATSPEETTETSFSLRLK